MALHPGRVVREGCGEGEVCGPGLAMRKRQPSRNEGMAQSSKCKHFDRHTGSGRPLRGPPSGGTAHRVPGLHSKAVGGGQVHQLSRAATTEHHRWG